MAKGIYKRKNSRYYWITYAGVDGKVIRESSGSMRFREAERLLISRRDDVSKGKQPEIKRIANHTFKELADKYLEWAKGRHLGVDSEAYRIGTMVSQFGGLPLRRFNTMLVEEYQSGLINRGLKNASVNKNVSLLKAMLHKAVQWDMLEESTLKRVRRVKHLATTGRLRYLSLEECRELIECCDSHLRPIVVTALNTGMRRGEVLGLKWEQVDLVHGFINLDRTKNGERRTLPLNATVRVTLRGLRRRLDSPFVFHDPNTGKRYKDVKKAFKSALRRAGIVDFKFHDLRHTFASHLVMQGVDLTSVKELLGHKTITMTLRYAHLAPAHKAKAVDVLDTALNGRTSHLLHTTIEKGATVNA